MNTPTRSILAPELEGGSWFKSSHSGGEQSCVEVNDLRATPYSTVAIRDSKNPTGPALLLPAGAFTAFIHQAATEAA